MERYVRPDPLRTCDIVHHNSDRRITDIGGNKRSESFLTCCVPKLKSNGAVLQIHGLGKKIDADGRLVCAVECIIHETGNYWCLSHRLITQEDQLVLGYLVRSLWLGSGWDHDGVKCKWIVLQHVDSTLMDDNCWETSLKFLYWLPGIETDTPSFIIEI